MTAVAAGVLAASEDGKAGPLGLLVILLLGAAIVVLGRSMGKHLRRVPPTFDRTDDGPGDTPSGTPSDTPGGDHGGPSDEDRTPPPSAGGTAHSS